MIGVFDSGFGGLTIHQALVQRLPHQSFLYLADHFNAPYGVRAPEEIVELTRANVDRLFRAGCRLVILACNTASAVALHTLQSHWLPGAWPGRNVLGIIVPTIEVATQVPWHVKTPVYPQKYNTQSVAVFATPRTVDSETYPVEITKRCPRMRVRQQACPELAGKIEAGASPAELQQLVQGYVAALMAGTGGVAPDWAILGCTHYPLVEPLFRAALPPGVRLICQPTAVADSLDDYLQRHPEYTSAPLAARTCRYFTTAPFERVNSVARTIFGGRVIFESLGSGHPGLIAC